MSSFLEQVEKMKAAVRLESVTKTRSLESLG